MNKDMLKGYKVITDDIEAELFLSQSGVIDGMKGSHEINSSTKNGIKNTIISFQTDESYVVSILISGHKEVHENGYLVLMLDKDSFTESEASQYIAQYVKDVGADPRTLHFGVMTPQNAGKN